MDSSSVLILWIALLAVIVTSLENHGEEPKTKIDELSSSSSTTFGVKIPQNRVNLQTQKDQSLIQGKFPKSHSDDQTGFDLTNRNQESAGQSSNDQRKPSSGVKFGARVNNFGTSTNQQKATIFSPNNDGKVTEKGEDFTIYGLLPADEVQQFRNIPSDELSISGFRRSGLRPDTAVSSDQDCSSRKGANCGITDHNRRNRPVPDVRQEGNQDPVFPDGDNWNSQGDRIEDHRPDEDLSAFDRHNPVSQEQPIKASVDDQDVNQDMYVDAVQEEDGSIAADLASPFIEQQQVDLPQGNVDTETRIPQNVPVSDSILGEDHGGVVVQEFRDGNSPQGEEFPGFPNQDSYDHTEEPLIFSAKSNEAGRTGNLGFESRTADSSFGEQSFGFQDIAQDLVSAVQHTRHFGNPVEWLRDSIPGSPGDDYPIFYQVPETQFQCDQQQHSAGIYGDMDTQCQVFHICENGRDHPFLCPNGTVFNQQYFVCDWWYQYNCSDTPFFYGLNAYIYWDIDTLTALRAMSGERFDGTDEHTMSFSKDTTSGDKKPSDISSTQPGIRPESSRGTASNVPEFRNGDNFDEEQVIGAPLQQSNDESRSQGDIGTNINQQVNEDAFRQSGFSGQSFSSVDQQRISNAHSSSTVFKDSHKAEGPTDAQVRDVTEFRPLDFGIKPADLSRQMWSQKSRDIIFGSRGIAAETSNPDLHDHQSSKDQKNDESPLNQNQEDPDLIQQNRDAAEQQQLTDMGYFVQQLDNRFIDETGFDSNPFAQAQIDNIDDTSDDNLADELMSEIYESNPSDVEEQINDGSNFKNEEQARYDNTGVFDFSQIDERSPAKNQQDFNQQQLKGEIQQERVNVPKDFSGNQHTRDFPASNARTEVHSQSKETSSLSTHDFNFQGNDETFARENFRDVQDLTKIQRFDQNVRQLINTENSGAQNDFMSTSNFNQHDENLNAGTGTFGTRNQQMIEQKDFESSFITESPNDDQTVDDNFNFNQRMTTFIPQRTQDSQHVLKENIFVNSQETQLTHPFDRTVPIQVQEKDEESFTIAPTVFDSARATQATISQETSSNQFSDISQQRFDEGHSLQSTTQFEQKQDVDDDVSPQQGQRNVGVNHQVDFQGPGDSFDTTTIQPTTPEISNTQNSNTRIPLFLDVPCSHQNPGDNLNNPAHNVNGNRDLNVQIVAQEPEEGLNFRQNPETPSEEDDRYHQNQQQFLHQQQNTRVPTNDNANFGRQVEVRQPSNFQQDPQTPSEQDNGYYSNQQQNSRAPGGNNANFGRQIVVQQPLNFQQDPQDSSEQNGGYYPDRQQSLNQQQNTRVAGNNNKNFGGQFGVRQPSNFQQDPETPPKQNGEYYSNQQQSFNQQQNTRVAGNNNVNFGGPVGVRQPSNFQQDPETPSEQNGEYYSNQQQFFNQQQNTKVSGNNNKNFGGQAVVRQPSNFQQDPETPSEQNGEYYSNQQQFFNQQQNTKVSGNNNKNFGGQAVVRQPSNFQQDPETPSEQNGEYYSNQQQSFNQQQNTRVAGNNNVNFGGQDVVKQPSNFQQDPQDPSEQNGEYYSNQQQSFNQQQNNPSAVSSGVPFQSDNNNNGDGSENSYYNNGQDTQQQNEENRDNRVSNHGSIRNNFQAPNQQYNDEQRLRVNQQIRMNTNFRSQNNQQIHQQQFNRSPQNPNQIGIAQGHQQFAANPPNQVLSHFNQQQQNRGVKNAISAVVQTGNGHQQQFNTNPPNPINSNVKNENGHQHHSNISPQNQVRSSIKTSNVDQQQFQRNPQTPIALNFRNEQHNQQWFNLNPQIQTGTSIRSGHDSQQDQHQEAQRARTENTQHQQQRINSVANGGIKTSIPQQSREHSHISSNSNQALNSQNRFNVNPQNQPTSNVPFANRPQGQTDIINQNPLNFGGRVHNGQNQRAQTNVPIPNVNNPNIKTNSGGNQQQRVHVISQGTNLGRGENSGNQHQKHQSPMQLQSQHQQQQPQQHQIQVQLHPQQQHIHGQSQSQHIHTQPQQQQLSSPQPQQHQIQVQPHPQQQHIHGQSQTQHIHTQHQQQPQHIHTQPQQLSSPQPQQHQIQVQPHPQQQHIHEQAQPQHIHTQHQQQPQHIHTQPQQQKASSPQAQQHQIQVQPHPQQQHIHEQAQSQHIHTQHQQQPQHIHTQPQQQKASSPQAQQHQIQVQSHPQQQHIHEQAQSQHIHTQHQQQPQHIHTQPQQQKASSPQAQQHQIQVQSHPQQQHIHEQSQPQHIHTQQQQQQLSTPQPQQHQLNPPQSHQQNPQIQEQPQLQQQQIDTQSPTHQIQVQPQQHQLNTPQSHQQNPQIQVQPQLQQQQIDTQSPTHQIQVQPQQQINSQPQQQPVQQVIDTSEANRQHEQAVNNLRPIGSLDGSQVTQQQTSVNLNGIKNGRQHQQQPVNIHQTNQEVANVEEENRQQDFNANLQPTKTVNVNQQQLNRNRQNQFNLNIQRQQHQTNVSPPNQVTSVPRTEFTSRQPQNFNRQFQNSIKTNIRSEIRNDRQFNVNPLNQFSNRQQLQIHHQVINVRQLNENDQHRNSHGQVFAFSSNSQIPRPEQGLNSFGETKRKDLDSNHEVKVHAPDAPDSSVQKINEDEIVNEQNRGNFNRNFGDNPQDVRQENFQQGSVEGYDFDDMVPFRLQRASRNVWWRQSPEDGTPNQLLNKAQIQHSTGAESRIQQQSDSGERSQQEIVQTSNRNFNVPTNAHQQVYQIDSSRYDKQDQNNGHKLAANQIRFNDFSLPHEAVLLVEVPKSGNPYSGQELPIVIPDAVITESSYEDSRSNERVPKQEYSQRGPIVSEGDINYNGWKPITKKYN